MSTAHLYNSPDGATKHVSRGQRSDHKSLPFSLQLDRLVVLELGDLLKAGVHFVQRKQVKLLDVMPRLKKNRG